jgi:hypothetical protein
MGRLRQVFRKGLLDEASPDRQSGISNETQDPSGGMSSATHVTWKRNVEPAFESKHRVATADGLSQKLFYFLDVRVGLRSRLDEIELNAGFGLCQEVSR